MGLLDFIRSGPDRRVWLDEQVGDLVEYFTPPNLRPAAEFAAQMNPIQGMSDSMSQFGVAVDPSRSMEDRRAAALGSVAEGLLAVAPAALAAKGYLTPAQGAMESLLGGSPATQQIGDDLGRFVVDEAGAFKLDNPGGRWLEEKIANARRDPARLEGSVTGYFDNDFQIPVRNFAYIDGARGEIRVPGEAQYDILMDKVKREGWSPTPVLVGINDRGRPYVIEGNTRLAVARELGIDTIPAEVRYWNGGEANAPTRWTPEYLERYATPTLPTPRNDAEAMARDILDQETRQYLAGASNGT